MKNTFASILVKNPMQTRNFQMLLIFQIPFSMRKLTVIVSIRKFTLKEILAKKILATLTKIGLIIMTYLRSSKFKLLHINVNSIFWTLFCAKIYMILFSSKNQNLVQSYYLQRQVSPMLAIKGKILR
jgi:hypothetical protein